MNELTTALDQLTEAFSTYCVLPPFAAETCAVWCAFTWAHDEAQTSPILLISSPTKRCGKSTLLRVIGNFVRRPLTASSVTPAVVFRLIQLKAPTLLMDEADNYVNRNVDWCAIINGGHTRDTANVFRCELKNLEPREFSTWAPKVLSMIGKPPDTILDRSIVIPLVRKLRADTVKSLRRKECTRLEKLRDSLQAAVTPHLRALRDAEPSPPTALNDRAADSWEPLLAIADLAGGHWPSTARRAAASLSGDASDDESEGIELLSNIRELLSERVEDRIFSVDLTSALISRTDWRWARHTDGHALSEKQLAVRLGTFGIHSKTMRITPELKRGYTVASFEDAFNRYLTPLPPRSATSQQEPDPTARALKANGKRAAPPFQGTQLQVPVFLDLKLQ